MSRCLCTNYRREKLAFLTGYFVLAPVFNRRFGCGLQAEADSPGHQTKQHHGERRGGERRNSQNDLGPAKPTPTRLVSRGTAVRLKRKHRCFQILFEIRRPAIQHLVYFNKYSLYAVISVQSNRTVKTGLPSAVAASSSLVTYGDAFDCTLKNSRRYLAYSHLIQEGE
jgi:hypothetical protein